MVDTSGFATWQVVDSIRENVDLFLYDLKMIDDERHKRYTGTSNKLILSNLQRLAESGSQIEIRIPLIPGVNDDVENLKISAAFIAGLPDITGIELMGYHDIAAAKYQSLGLVYQLPNTTPPSDAAILAAAQFFEDVGLNIKTS